jgi:chemotaxis protein methyltransferase CheR
MDTNKAGIVGRVDAVFCRNVLIYLDVRSRRKVIDSLYDRLVPGGILFLGHSESLLNVTTAFELVHLSEDLVYRKPLAPERSSSGAR